MRIRHFVAHGRYGSFSATAPYAAVRDYHSQRHGGYAPSCFCSGGPGILWINFWDGICLVRKTVTGCLRKGRSEDDLIVNVGSIGRFYTFDLARQMHRLGKLGSMYTAYPKWKVDHFPTERVRTFPWWMMATSAVSRFAVTGLNRWLN